LRPLQSYGSRSAGRHRSKDEIAITEYGKAMRASIPLQPGSLKRYLSVSCL